MIAPERAIVTVAIGRFEPLVYRGLIDVLGEDRRVEVLASGLDDHELEGIVVQQMPQVVILGEATARSAFERLRKTAPATGVVVLANGPTREYGLRVLAAGATCVARNAPTADLIEAVHLVARGEPVFMSGDGDRVERRYPSGAPALTPRQTEVFRHLSRGRRHAEIAHDLRIGVRTVHTYTAQICRKLDVRSKRELIGMSIPGDPSPD